MSLLYYIPLLRASFVIKLLFLVFVVCIKELIIIISIKRPVQNSHISTLVAVNITTLGRIFRPKHPFSILYNELKKDLGLKCS